MQLAEEVEDLQHKGKTHFDDLYEAKEGQRIAESRLADIEQCIKKDQEEFQAERDPWATEKVGLIAAKEAAVIAKLAAEVKTSEAESRVAELLAHLAEVEKLAQTEEQWFCLEAIQCLRSFRLTRCVARLRKWGRMMPWIG